MTSSQLERRVRFLTSYACCSTLLFLVIFISGLDHAYTTRSEKLKVKTIKADTVNTNVLVTQQMKVIDNGITRIRLGTKLPDAVIEGKRIPRGNVAGIILYDNTGQERGGYVTFDESGNIVLTLDGRKRQTAFFMADTSGATALRLWKNDHAIDLRSDSDGARITALRDGHVVYQQPEMLNPKSSATCSALRGLRNKISEERIMSICKERMTEEACLSCMESP